MSAAAPGATSSMTTRARGRSSSDVTGRPVSIVPPSSRSTPASAALIACEPPSATGHPCAWPAAVSARPTDADSGLFNGCTRCAATPANSARASSVRQRRATAVAGSSARSPNPASRNGCRGRCGDRPQDLARRARRTRRRGERTGGATPGRRRRGGRPSRRPIAAARAARPPSSGWASWTGGQRHRSPCAARSSELKNGEATPIGWNAEQSSCSRPGQGQLAAAGPAADPVGRLQHGDLDARPGPG